MKIINDVETLTLVGHENNKNLQQMNNLNLNGNTFEMRALLVVLTLDRLWRKNNKCDKFAEIIPSVAIFAATKFLFVLFTSLQPIVCKCTWRVSLKYFSGVQFKYCFVLLLPLSCLLFCILKMDLMSIRCI